MLDLKHFTFLVFYFLLAIIANKHKAAEQNKPFASIYQAKKLLVNLPAKTSLPKRNE